MNRQPRILQVEDSAADRMLTAEALIENGSRVEVRAVETIPEAKAMLACGSEWLPDLLLLDLSVGGGSGFSVLEVMKQSVALRQIPVVVFSSSKRASDVRRAYDLFANCYVAKPADFEGYRRVLAEILDFWLVQAQLLSLEDA